MKTKITVITSAVVTLALSSCANMTHEQQRAAQGAALGAAAGAIIGNQRGSSLKGAALGAGIGGAGGYMYGRGETGAY